MTEQEMGLAATAGEVLRGPRGRRVGRVDAVFVDYLLVRSGWIMPVDLYVPRDAITRQDGRLCVDLDRGEAYRAWHRPLKRAPHS